MKTILSIILVVFLLSDCSTSTLPYDVEDGYIFIQKESRRNDSAEWKLVWEDQFDQGILDTTQWSRIGLFTSPPWNTTVEKWQEVTNCFRYISATDNRVVQFDKDNIPEVSLMKFGIVGFYDRDLIKFTDLAKVSDIVENEVYPLKTDFTREYTFINYFSSDLMNIYRKVSFFRSISLSISIPITLFSILLG